MYIMIFCILSIVILKLGEHNSLKVGEPSLNTSGLEGTYLFENEQNKI